GAAQPWPAGQPGSPPPQWALRGLSARALGDRRGLLRRLDEVRRDTDREAGQALDQFRQQAFSVLTSPAVARAFDLDRESPKLRQRYGRHLWGQACLLARRLAEAGTPVVSVIAHTPDAGPTVTHPDDHPRNARRPSHFA